MRLGFSILVAAVVSTVLYPLFFIIYRLSVFNTVPRDDYAPFLLWIVNRPGAAFPESPYGYRLLSMIAAAPFYYGLPVLSLTNTPAGLSVDYLRATGALTAVAFIGWIVTAMLAYATALRAGLDGRGALLAAVFAFIAMNYVQITAIDPLAVAFIAAAVWLLPKRRAFAALLVISVPLNEKVALVLALWLTVRCLFCVEDRAQLWRQGVCAILAVVAYVAMVQILRLPGNQYQLDPHHYPVTVLSNLAAYLSARGLLLNVLPILVLLGMALFGHPAGLFRRVDALVIPALSGVALFLTQDFQAGRIVMHAAPLFVVPAARRCQTWLSA